MKRFLSMGIEECGSSTEKLWGIVKPRKHVKNPKKIARKTMEKDCKGEYEIH